MIYGQPMPFNVAHVGHKSALPSGVLHSLPYGEPHNMHTELATCELPVSDWAMLSLDTFTANLISRHFSWHRLVHGERD